MTSSGPNDTSRLPNAELGEKVVTDGCQQPNALPPPYEVAVGQSSIPYQSVSGQSFIGNYYTPTFQQPPPYYDYSPFQPATGQFTLPEGVSALPIGQPIYPIPMTARPANSYQPSVISQYDTQSQPITMQLRNMGESRRGNESKGKTQKISMPPGSNDTIRLLDVESVEEVVNERYPHQPNAQPPPYQMVPGLSSIPNQSVYGQITSENNAPLSNQPPTPMYYGFTHLQPTTGQLLLPGGVSALPNGQPIYLIQATGLPANVGRPQHRPQIITQHRPPRPRPSRSQPRNTRRSNRASDPNANDDICTSCCCGVIYLMTMAAIVFLLAMVFYIFNGTPK